MAASLRTRVLFIFRALLALGVLAGYYTLSLLIAAVAITGIVLLLWTHRVYPVFVVLVLAMVAILSLYTAGKTFLSTRRRDGENFGGIWLEREREPDLFGIVDELARTMGTRAPGRIVLIPASIAYVTERGGFLGFGRERILGLGYLTLRLSSVSELRATLAHELGHFAAGDTFLGPLVHRSHQVLAQSILALEGSKAAESGVASLDAGQAIVNAILSGYGKLAMRATRAAGRLHELEADRQAVKYAGRGPHVRSLARLPLALVTFQQFLAREIDPLVATGHWPSDFWGGYDAFAQSVHDELRQVVDEDQPSPYDTHPSLPHRLAFAESVPDPGLEEDTRPALALVRHPHELWSELEALVDEGRPRAAWTAVANLRAKSVHELASEAFTCYQGMLRGPSWLAMAKDGVRCLRAEGAYRMTVAVEPGLGQVTKPVWEAVAPVVFGRAFGAIVGMALAEDLGGTFVHVFGKPLQVDLAGLRHCPATLASEAAQSFEGLEKLRALLETPPIPRTALGTSTAGPEVSKN